MEVLLAILLVLTITTLIGYLVVGLAEVALIIFVVTIGISILVWLERVLRSK